MSTNDVPGAKSQNNDTLALGAWAEHADGSLIFVESVEAGKVVYSMFDLSRNPPIEYRDAMPEDGFKTQFSWPNKDDIRWTWHDKTPFDWARVMGQFPSGMKHASAANELSAAARIAESLDLKAEAVRERQYERPTMQRAATQIMTGIRTAIAAIKD